MLLHLYSVISKEIDVTQSEELASRPSAGPSCAELHTRRDLDLWNAYFLRVFIRGCVLTTQDNSRVRLGISFLRQGAERMYAIV